MQEYIWTTGMILRTEPISDYDRRVVILTKEHGKITAFAKGARRQTNKLIAATDLFDFGEFKLFPGRNSYSMVDASIKNYFEELRSDFNLAMYGMYFLEIMDYNTRENNDEREMLKLLYQSLKALIHAEYDNRLVRTVFELKTIMLMGEFHRDAYREGYQDTTLYTLDYIAGQKPESIYTFRLSDTILTQLMEISKKERLITWNHVYKSEEMLSVIDQN